MTLHAASSDLLQRALTSGRPRPLTSCSTFLQRSIGLARVGHAWRGGPTTSKVTILVGRDTNIAAVAGLLNAHWLINAYQRDDAAPGGALVFELWQRDGSPAEVRLSYMLQTPAQMRNETVLDKGNRPGEAVVFIPGCSSAGCEAPCSWPSFVHVIQASTDVNMSGR